MRLVLRSKREQLGFGAVGVGLQRCPDVFAGVDMAGFQASLFVGHLGVSGVRNKGPVAAQRGLMRYDREGPPQEIRPPPGARRRERGQSEVFPAKAGRGVIRGL